MAQAPKKSNWDKLTAKLSPRTRHQVQESVTVASPDDGNHSEFQTFQKDLSPAARKALAARAESVEPEAWPEDVEPSWCLIESHDGEYPEQRSYPTVEAMIQRMHELEGQDVCVFASFGIPLPFSHDEPRIVFLPSHEAVRLDSHSLDEEVLEEDVQLQEDGFLGPEELQQPSEEEDSDVVDADFEIVDADDESA